MVCKVVRRVFIYLGAVFLMSHIISNNVSAFEISQNVRPSTYLATGSLYWQDDKDGNTWRSTTTKSYSSSTVSHAVFYRFSNSSRTLRVENNDYVVIAGSYFGTSAYGGSSNTVGGISIGSEALRCPIIDLNQSNVSIDNVTSNNQIGFMTSFQIVCRSSTLITDFVAINLNLDVVPQSASDFISISFDSMLVFHPDTSLYQIYTWLQNNSDDAGSTLKQEKQDVQDAADNSETSGESSSQDAEAGTASLISAIGSAVSVISSASPTNCRINGDMGKLDVGQIDLCANPVPAFVQVIGSLILILITVPLCITLFNRFIGLFRSFQG